MPDALSTAQSIFAGAVALVKGIKQPTLPRKATFTHIHGVSLARSHHSASVIKGRTYIFGGEDAPGHLAGNSMHIINLPSDVMAADYQSIPARPARRDDPVPARRKAHSAVVVGDHIYLFGGQLETSVEEPQGRLWVYSSYTNTWSFMDPAPGSAFPCSRYHHASGGSEEPQAELAPPKPSILPQQPPDPAKYLSEPPEPNSWGTIFVAGGRAVQGKEAQGEAGAEGKLLADAWIYDIRSRTWFSLPAPPGTGRAGASLAVAGEKIYLFGGSGGLGDRRDGSIDWLEVGGVWKFGLKGSAFGDLSKSSLVGDWQTATPERQPGARSNAGLIEVTTGQGRGCLIMIGGNLNSKSALFSDEVWLYQLPSSSASPAGMKDLTKSAANQANQEGAWAEVIYQPLNEDGDIVQVQMVGTPTSKGLGARGYFGCAKGTEVDGATAVVWGGLGVDGKILSDGWMITVE